MALSSLIPINRPCRRGSHVPVRHPREDAFTWLQEEINRLFEDFMPDAFRRGGGWMPFLGGDAGFMPDVDVKETKKDIRVSVELPGVEEDDVDVRLDGNSLTIRGEKKEEKTEKEDGWTHTECAYGSFMRSVPLGVEVDEENAEATFKKGVLKVRLPKRNPDSGKAGRIAVKGD